MIGAAELADAAHRAMLEYGALHVSFGDGTGHWIGVSELDLRLCVGHYGRTRGALDELARQGRARRHSSGADYWQPTGGARG